MSRQVRVIFGPPGTGKTTRLLLEIQREIESGTPAERVGFVSFSRRAVLEAASRVSQAIPGLTPAAFPHFRTIHATAFHLLGLGRGDVMQREHLSLFGQTIGERFRSGDHDWLEGSAGDRCLGLHQLAEARGTSLEHEYRRANVPEPSWTQVRDFSTRYTRYKERHALWDFGDMIAQASGELPVDVLYIDEAQDTSWSQWRMLHRIAQNVPRIWLAGDDDQAIYAWSGADENYMRTLPAERIILPQSYRLPVRVKALADRVVRRIRTRVPKSFSSRIDMGEVQWVNDLDHVNLRQPGSWLLLARSNYQLRVLRSMARAQGVVYTLTNGAWSWTLPAVRAATVYERLRKGQPIDREEARLLAAFLPDPPAIPPLDQLTWTDWLADRPSVLNWMDGMTLMSDNDRSYVRAVRRAGESLSAPGRVRIGTVHSAKGAEADNVLLLTDISQRIEQAAALQPDAELRVQYVAVTRARQRLILASPISRAHWSF